MLLVVFRFVIINNERASEGNLSAELPTADAEECTC